MVYRHLVIANVNLSSAHSNNLRSYCVVAGDFPKRFVAWEVCRWNEKVLFEV